MAPPQTNEQIIISKEKQCLIERNEENASLVKTPKEVWMEEALQVFHLAVPSILINISTMIPGAIMSSYTGRYLGDTELSGVLLGFSIINVFYLAVITGLVTAVDTLCPQAFGSKNYAEVGIVTLRGLIVCIIYSIVPVKYILFDLKNLLLNVLGLNKEVVEFAMSFTKIWLPVLPFYIIFILVWKFLSAQEIVYPLVYSGITASMIFLPTSIYFLGSRFGFQGVIFSFDIFQVTVVFLTFMFMYLGRMQSYVPETWSSNKSLHEKFTEAILMKPFLKFCRLAIGGLLATSEWWFWEVICVLVGIFGVEALAAHTVPTMYINICFVFLMGYGLALNVRIGSTLAVNGSRAKQICYWGLAFGILICAAFAIHFTLYKRWIISLFTESESVILLLDEIWFYASIYVFFVCVFALIINVINAVGYQWTMGYVVVICLWVFTLPLIYFTAVAEGSGRGFILLWQLLSIPYALMDFMIFMVLFTRIDWEVLTMKIKKQHSNACVLNVKTKALEYGSDHSTLHDTLA